MALVERVGAAPAAAAGSEYVVALGTDESVDDAVVGRKAATLERLGGGGFLIPDSMVLTTGAFTDEDAAAGSLPERVESAIAQIAARFGDATLAVRSSSTAEDEQTASWAGLFETVLDVRGVDALRRAVLTCWASASGERAAAYQPAAAQPQQMAVLIQRQLTPDIAGVAFTADPVTGARDVTLISAAPGRGDSVVGGAVTPDEWRVDGESAAAIRAALGALTAEQAVAVAELARRVEDFLGAPQDIEWAMDSGRLFILQARPITTLPRPPRAQLPRTGTWVKETDRYPEPMTELGASLATGLVSAGLTNTFADYGSLIERVDCRSIGGEFYQRIVPFGPRSGKRSAPPSRLALAVLVRCVPKLRRRMGNARRNGTPQRLAALADQWFNESRRQLQLRIDELAGQSPATLGDREFAAHLQGVLSLASDAMALHFRLTAAEVVPLYRLVAFCHHVLGFNDAQTLELLAGTSATTSEPAREMAELAAGVQRIPALVEELRGGADPATALRSHSAGLASAFDDWCRRYATRCMNDDPGSATLAEQPALLRTLLLDTRPESDPSHDGAADIQRNAREAARRQLAAKGARLRRRFERALAQAETCYGLREDVAFWTGSMCGGLVRRAAVEAGNRLAADGRINRPTDAVQLDVDTLVAAVDGTMQTAALKAMIAAAKAERVWVRQHPGPALVGEAPPEIDLRGLPRAARELNAAFFWYRFGGASGGGDKGGSAAAEEGAPGDDASTIGTGVAASPGRHTGPVRRIRSEADFGKLHRGDVMVTHTADPAWSVLFGVAGALVTDSGGLLSHAAIVARELGIPAVLGVLSSPGTGLDALRDGDVVTVDGSRGIVQVASVNAADAEHVRH